MQAIVETLFDAAYLSTVITIGILMIRRSKGNVQYTLFGWMAVVLGAGDSFHLIPRALALCDGDVISPEDLSLFAMVETAEEAVAVIDGWAIPA